MTNTLQSFNVTNRIENKKEILCCVYTPDRAHILTGATDGVVRKYACGGSEVEQQFQDEDVINDPNPVTCIKIKLKQPYFLATYAHGYVKYWNMDNATCKRTIHEDRQTLGLTLHPTESKFLTMGDDACLLLYDEERGTTERKFFNSFSPEKVEGHNSRVFAAKFHPKKRTEFISGGWDDTVQFWDIRKSQSSRYFCGPHICGEGLDIDRTGDQILTCSYSTDKSLAIWDYNTGTMGINIDSETNKLYCGKFTNQNFVASGGSDPCEFRLTNLFTYSTVAVIRLPHMGIYSIASYLRPVTGTRKEFSINAAFAIASNNILTELEIQYTFT